MRRRKGKTGEKVRELASEAKPSEGGKGVGGGLAPCHDRILSNLTLKMVHSGGFENVNL